MQQLSMPLEEKLDLPLAEVCNAREFAASARVPVIVRCEIDAIAAIAAQISALGGTVRHRLSIVGAVAAWLPLFAVAVLAKNEAVRLMELEQEFTAA